MIEQQNIDELFKEGLSGVQVEPSPQVWESVESRFFGRSKLIVRYLIGAAALLLMLVGGGYWYFYGDTDAVSNLMDDEMVINTTDSENTNKGNTTIDFESNKTSAKRPTSVLAQDGAAKNDDQITSEISSTNTEMVDATPDQVKESAQSPSELLLPTVTPLGNSKNNVVMNENTGTGINENEFLGAGYTGSVLSDRPYQSIYSITPMQVGIQDSYKVQMIDPDEKEIVGMKTFMEKQKRSHIYTGASATVGMIYYPSTKDQFTWSADASLGITAKRFYFETGVGYGEINEEGIYLIDLQSYDSVGFYNKVEPVEDNRQNPDEIIYNTKKVTVYDSIEYYTHTSPTFKYNYLNVPVLVGFKFFDKDKFSASVETGLLFSIMVSKDIPNANYQNPDYTVVGTRNITPERVDWNYRWQIGIRLNYKVKKSLSISAEPVFTKYLNSIYDTDKGYENVKPYTMGFKFGLYYGF